MQCVLVCEPRFFGVMEIEALTCWCRHGDLEESTRVLRPGYSKMKKDTRGGRSLAICGHQKYHGIDVRQPVL